MFGAHVAVSLCAVLEHVARGVLVEALPSGSHLCRSLCEIELGAEVIDVVVLVHLEHLLDELAERLPLPVLVEEAGESLVELMEGLDAGEHIVAPMEPLPHGIAHRHTAEAAVQDRCV